MHNTPIKKVFNMLWGSDQHTLHPTTPTVLTLEALSRFYYIDHNLADIDLIVLGGDFFDHLVDAADKNLRHTEYWIKTFLERCREHDVVVRVLEGTSSHDWQQPEMFKLLAPEGLDLEWVKTLSVERIDRFGITALYVPDNMGSKTAQEIWENTLEILTQAELTQVDFCFFHGAFKYQLPPHINHGCHDEHQWLSLVRFGIFAGHVHIPSEFGNDPDFPFKKIYVSGSFDRIRHGEEHPKGGYHVTVDTEKPFMKATFWENKKSLPYITIKITPETLAEELNAKLWKVLDRNTLPMYSQVNVKGGKGEVVGPVLEYFKAEFPQYGLKATNAKAEGQVVDNELYNDATYQGVVLDCETLGKALIDHITETDSLNGESPEDLLALLEEFL